MPFCPAKKFTQEWENIVHCTKFREYSCAHKAKIDYKNSKEPQNDDDDFDDYYDYVSDEEDDVEQEKFEWHRKQLLGAKRLTLKEPFRLYLDDEKGMALYQLDFADDNWILMLDGKLEARCPTCDGGTESSYKVREALDLHDMIYNVFTEAQRQQYGIEIGDDETLNAFRSRVTQQQLLDLLCK